jgi:hypothetical protein
MYAAIAGQRVFMVHPRESFNYGMCPAGGWVSAEVWSGIMRVSNHTAPDREPALQPECRKRSWRLTAVVTVFQACFFEPESRCSYEADVMPLIEAGATVASEYGASGQWRNKSYQVQCACMLMPCPCLMAPGLNSCETDDQVVNADGWLNKEGFHLDHKSPIWDDFFERDDREKYAIGLLYLFRLNRATASRFEEMMAELLPCDFDPERTIGLPIRGSDKCMGGRNPPGV